MTSPPRLEATLRSFADRLFQTGGRDPGDAALALPPARLAIYRDMLRGNYRAMLRFAFTCAFDLMDRELAAAAGADGLPADTDAILVRFLQVAPSRTHSSREIADRFLVFLPREVPKLCARRPDLPALMTLERAELGAMFAPDDPGRCLTHDEAAALAQGSLEDLLAREILLAPSASVLSLAHPVVDLRVAIERGETPPAPGKEPEHATVGRGAPPAFPIEFAVHSAEAATVFRLLRPGTPVTAESLAQTWIAALPPSAQARDDAWKASTFAAAIVTGLTTGALRAK